MMPLLVQPVPMLQFLAPDRLWLLLLIPALVGGYLLLSRRRASKRRSMGRTMFDLVIPKDRVWVRHVAVGLSILSLLTLTLAFAKPKDQVLEDRQRATIVVTIDVSLSMEATDVEPTRLEAAKTAASAFVTSLPPKFNVSLVSFAGTATTLVPPTLDRGAVTAAIEALQPQPSTAIGEGIYTSLAALSQVPPDPNDPGRRRTGPHRAAERRQDPGRPRLRSGRPGRPGPERADLHDRVRHRGRLHRGRRTARARPGRPGGAAAGLQDLRRCRRTRPRAPGS